MAKVVWFRADRGYGYLRDRARGGESTYGELFFDRSHVVGQEPASVGRTYTGRFLRWSRPVRTPSNRCPL